MGTSGSAAMRTVEEHLNEVLATVSPLAPLRLPLLDACGCVLAEDLAAAWPLPPFDNSGMDGYAVVAADLAPASPSSPVRLTVVGDIPAGARELPSVVAGSAARIMTGAPMPPGADAVVPVEQTDGGTDVVTVLATVEPGAYVRRVGEDLAQGVLVLAAGSEIGARQSALLASAGHGDALVHPRPRVVVVSTGDELVDAGTVPRPGQIPDSNSVTIAAAVIEAGGVAYRVGPVRDDADALLSLVNDQLVRADAVVTTGGVSMGAFDTVKEVFGRTDTVAFHKVAMQPGMPQGFGRIGPDDTPLFALPGNPVSAYVSFEVFVRPALRRMAGHRSVFRPIVRALCAESFPSPAGRRQFARAVLTVDHGAYVVRPVVGQASHMLGGLARSNALIIVPPEQTVVSTGESVVVMRLDDGDEWAVTHER